MTRSIRNYEKGKVVVSVIVPCMNEEATVAELFDRTAAALSALDIDFEIIFVDDGSTDGTIAVVENIVQTHRQSRLIAFSRNFGKEAALTAGLDAAEGQAVILMDADLQHPPEFIPQLYAAWSNGGEVVYGVRTDRETDGLLRRSFSNLFYNILLYIGETPIPSNAGDFRLLDRKVVESLRALHERNRFMKGLYAWVGYKTVALPLTIEERKVGESRFSFSKLVDFAIDGITAFSNKPLRLAGYTGALIAGCSLVYGGIEVVRALFLERDTPGYASLIFAVTFLGGIQMIFLGVIGEYIGRIYTESKGRPIYLVRDRKGFGK